MKLTRLWAIARKEFIHLIRDWRSLAMGIGFPMLMLFLNSAALSLDVDHVPVILWDQSQSAASRDLLSRFAGSRYFTLVGSFKTYNEMSFALDARKALLALVIPSDFGRRVESGRLAELQAIVDGSDSTTAQIALGYVNAVTSTYSTMVNLRTMTRHGQKPITGTMDVRPVVWFNPELESKNFIIPGLIVIIMMVISGLLTSLTVAREWENGTMEQLITSPIRGSELIVGKLIPYFSLGMFDMFLCNIVGRYVFGVPFRGSLILLIITAVIFLIGSLGMGMLISIVAKKQLVANQLAALTTFLPAMMLSGFVYNITNMPKPVQLVTYLVPARYFIFIIKSIYLKGVGLRVVWFQLLLLLAFAIAMMVMAHRAFKKRIV